MPISFACAARHAPGITAWSDAAPAAQKDTVYGAFELLSWLALGGRRGEVVAYEAVKPWATGVGLMTFGAAA
jgi:hypothetical protein